MQVCIVRPSITCTDTVLWCTWNLISLSVSCTLLGSNSLNLCDHRPTIFFRIAFSLYCLNIALSVNTLTYIIDRSLRNCFVFTKLHIGWVTDCLFLINYGGRDPQPQIGISNHAFFLDTCLLHLHVICMCTRVPIQSKYIHRLSRTCNVYRCS